MNWGISFRKGANLPSGILDISKFGGAEWRAHPKSKKIAEKRLLIVIPILNRNG
jgi:hypothetical protein